MSDNTPIDAVTEVAKSANSFAELAKSVLSPVVSRWETKAELSEIERKIAFAKIHPEVDFVIREDGTAGFITSAEQELAIRAGRRAIAESERRQRNLEQVYLNAASDIDDTEATPESPIYEDWLTRLNSIVQDISDPEMQIIWGKILAGEYKKPGSYSMRTLEIIRNLTKEDAQAFEQIMPLVINHGGMLFVPSNKQLLDKYGVYYINLLRLDECQLLNSSGTLSLNLFLEGKRQEFWHNYHQIMFLDLKDENVFKYSIGIHTLTTAAVELYHTLVHPANEAFFSDFLDTVIEENRGKNIKLHIHDITGIDGDRINFSRSIVKESEAKQCR